MRMRRADTVSLGVFRSLVFLSLVCLAGPSRAWAQAPLPFEDDEVEFEVNVCLASKEEGGVDPECQSMQEQLPVRFGTLRLQQRANFALAFGEPHGLALPSGSQLLFRPISIVDRKLQMHVQMPGVVNTRVQLGSGRSIILAGVRHNLGNLIVELRPTFIVPPTPQSPIAKDVPRARSRVPEVRRVGGQRSQSAR